MFSFNLQASGPSVSAIVSRCTTAFAYLLVFKNYIQLFYIVYCIALDINMSKQEEEVIETADTAENSVSNNLF